MRKEEEIRQALDRMIRQRVKTFSRVEKAFYGSIILTGVIMAASIIFMQTSLLQVQKSMTELQTRIDAEQIVLNDAKQSVNELTRYSRLMELATEAGLTFDKEKSGALE